MRTRVMPDEPDLEDADAATGSGDDGDPLETPMGTRVMPDTDGNGIPDAFEEGPSATPDPARGKADEGGSRRSTPPPMGTRVLPEDLDLDAPMPEVPIGTIAPPEQVDTGPEVVERFGVRFVGGEDDAAELLDRIARHARRMRAGDADGDAEGEAEGEAGAAEAAEAARTVVDGTRSEERGRRGEGGAGDRTLVAGAGDDAPDAADADRRPGEEPGGISILLVGHPHTGQRRLARLIARTLAEQGVGDGSVRLAHGAELRGATLDDIGGKLDVSGETLLLERFDTVLSGAADPSWMARAVRDLRRDRTRESNVILTCPPEAYDRMADDAAALFDVFEVFRLPDLADVESRMALLHVLADERRVTIGGPALDIVKADLERLSGPGDLVNARLVEAYLERACARYYARMGTAHDRLVLGPEDFTGLAEEIEPALRDPRDVETYLNRLNAMIGLDEVRQTIDGLVAEARLAAERAEQGLPPGNVSRHLIFIGPRGTGKSTVARLVGGIYAALGLLDSGHVVACRAAHLAGRDRADTAAKVSLHVDQAMGGVLLIQGAERLAQRGNDTTDELLRFMDERRDKFMVICAGANPGMDEFLMANPGFRAEFGAILEFPAPTERELVKMFQRFAERDLYMLDEELRVELMDRFATLREDPDFANAHTVREMFEETVARQAARLARSRVDVTMAARLGVQDLPESRLQEALGDLRESPES